MKALDISLVLIALATTAYGEITIQPVACSGESAPGADANIRFTQFADPQINDLGDILFIGRMAGPGISSANNAGIWIGPPGDLRLAVQTGDHAGVEEEGAAFDFFAVPFLGNAGASFYARLRGPGISTDSVNPGNDDSLWGVRIVPIDTSLLVGEALRLPRDGPSTNDKKYLEEFRRSLSRSGKPVSNRRLCYALKRIQKKSKAQFNESIDRFSNRPDALFALRLLSRNQLISDPKRYTWYIRPELKADRVPRGGGGGGPVTGLVQNDSIIAAEADPAPGTGTAFTDIDVSDFALSRKNLVFTGATSAGIGLWQNNAAGTAPLALPGEPLPPPLGDGLDLGHSLNRIDRVGINARGEVAFVGTAGQTDFVAAGPPEAPVLVARSESGGTGLDAFSVLVMNAAGDVAFLAEHSELEPDARGLFLTFDHGVPVRVLTEGMTAVGLEPGEVISVFGDGLFMNRLGQVAVQAGFGSAAGFENTTGYGIWLIDPVNGAQLVIKQDALFDTGSGQMRRVVGRPTFASSFEESLGGGEDGSLRCLNDHGQLVFVATWIEDETLFTTKTGVFIASDPAAGLTYNECVTRVHRLSGDEALQLADPDNDGVPNIIDCTILGGAPNDPTRIPVLPAPVFDDENRAHFGLPKAPGIVDVTYQFQRRDASGNWVPDGFTVVEENAFRYHVRLDDPVPEQIVRLAVTVNP